MEIWSAFLGMSVSSRRTRTSQKASAVRATERARERQLPTSGSSHGRWGGPSGEDVDVVAPPLGGPPSVPRALGPEGGHGDDVRGGVGVKQLQGDGHELLVVEAARESPHVAAGLEVGGSGVLPLAVTADSHLQRATV